MKDKQCFICIAKAIKENTKNITLTQKAAWFRGDKSISLISLIALPEAFEVGGLFFCLYFVPIFQFIPFHFPLILCLGKAGLRGPQV